MNTFSITHMSKKCFDKHIKTSQVFYCYYPTPAGQLLLLATSAGIFKAEFVSETPDLPEYQKDNTITLNKFLTIGTAFQLAVWQAALTIPTGSVLSYQQLAHRIQKSKAYRAVGSALGKNAIAYFIPCHRVVLSNRKIGNYKWGSSIKEKLLHAEQAIK